MSWMIRTDGCCSCRYCERRVPGQDWPPAILTEAVRIESVEDLKRHVEEAEKRAAQEGAEMAIRWKRDRAVEDMDRRLRTIEKWIADTPRRCACEGGEESPKEGRCGNEQPPREPTADERRRVGQCFESTMLRHRMSEIEARLDAVEGWTKEKDEERKHLDRIIGEMVDPTRAARPKAEGDIHIPIDP